MTAPARRRFLVWGADEHTLEGLDELPDARDIVVVGAGRGLEDPSVIDQVLDVTDRMDRPEDGWTLALGPDVFGWATTGQLTDLRGWCDMWQVRRVVVYAPPVAEPDPVVLDVLTQTAIEVAHRLHGMAAVNVRQPRALEALASIVDGTWTGRTAAGGTA